MIKIKYNKIMNYLLSVEIRNDKNNDKFPYNLPLFSGSKILKFKTPITFIVGENGAGKSTFLESLAGAVGFNKMGGNANHNYGKNNEEDLSDIMRLSWRIKTKKGFFFRAESFFDFSSYIDKVIEEDRSIIGAYGGKKLNHQSHGESFLSLFSSKFRDGLFILDEPEAALSPERQMALITILNELVLKSNAQFIIATHSPILIATPNSTIYEIKGNEFVEKKYKQTKQFCMYKDFLDCPERYINYLTKE